MLSKNVSLHESSSLHAGSLKTLKSELEKQLESYTSIDLSAQKGRRSADEAHVLELTLKALILGVCVGFFISCSHN